MRSVSDKAACSLILTECWPLAEEEPPGSGLWREPVRSAEGRRGPGVKHILKCRNDVGLPWGRVCRAGMGGAAGGKVLQGWK